MVVVSRNHETLDVLSALSHSLQTQLCFVVATTGLQNLTQRIESMQISTTVYQEPKKGFSKLSTSLIREIGSFLPLSDRARIARCNKTTWALYQSGEALVQNENRTVTQLIKKAMNETTDPQEREYIFEGLAKYGKSITALDLSLLENLSTDFLEWIVASFPDLQELHFELTNIDDEGLTILYPLRDTLKILNLRDCQEITSEGFSKLQPFKRLQYLNLQSTKINNIGFRSVCRLPNLLDLNVNDCRFISTAGFVSLRQLKNLEILDISSTTIDNDGLQAICRIEKLRELTMVFPFSNMKITVEGFHHLRQLQHIQRLHVTNALMNNDHLQIIGQISSLTDLSLAECPTITSEGIAFLQPLQKLEMLNLNNAYKINDQAIKYLANLKKLRILNPNHQMTQDGLDRLRESIPGLVTIL